MCALEEEKQNDENRVIIKNQESLGSWTDGHNAMQFSSFKLRKLDLGFNQLQGLTFLKRAFISIQNMCIFIYFHPK